jgi:hypothetical protein
MLKKYAIDYTTEKTGGIRQALNNYNQKQGK